MVYRPTQKTIERNTRRRNEILTSARTLFAQRGYEKTTMNLIVKKAGTSIGNCYFYFRNKEDLLREIVQEIVARVWRDSDELTSRESSAVVRLGLVIYRLASYMLKDDETARMILIGNAIPSVRQSMFEDFHARIDRLVQSGPHFFRDEHREFNIVAGYGSIIWVLERKRSQEIDYRAEDIGRFLVQWNLRAIGLPELVVVDTLKTINGIIATGQL